MKLAVVAHKEAALAERLAEFLYDHTLGCYEGADPIKSSGADHPWASRKGESIQDDYRALAYKTLDFINLPTKEETHGLSKARPMVDPVAGKRKRTPAKRRAPARPAR